MKREIHQKNIFWLLYQNRPLILKFHPKHDYCRPLKIDQNTTSTDHKKMEEIAEKRYCSKVSATCLNPREIELCRYSGKKFTYHWFFILFSFFFINLCFYPGNKCEALRLGVHLILLYFIRISLSTPKTFFVISLGGGGWGVAVSNFLFFKSLDNNMVYSLGIGIYRCWRKLSRTKILWV